MMHLLGRVATERITSLMLRHAFAIGAAAVKHRFCNSLRGFLGNLVRFLSGILARFRQSGPGEPRGWALRLTV
jgi:hypothetical protein